MIRDLEQRFVSGGDCTGEVQSLIPQGEDPRSRLNWLCLALFFLKALLLKNWTSGVVLVVVVRLLQGL